MKLAIFGATGRTGRHLVAQALAQGHIVTAFAREPSRIVARNDRLRIVRGNVFNLAEVENAVVGQDAVLSALGMKPWSRARTLSEGTRNIVAAMERFGIKKFVCESSFGVGDSKQQTDWFTRLMIRIFLGRIYADKEIQEPLIQQSNLEWVIVRPARLTNGRQRGRYRSGVHLKPGLFGSIARADVAAFMLQQVTSPAFLRQCVTISD